MQQKRSDFWELVGGILAKDLIFIDESGVNLALTRLFARAPKGQRARGQRPHNRGRNVSLIGAIGLNGVLTHVSLLKVKSLLRSFGARNYPDLAKAIEKAFEKVSLDDLRGWFTHCCYCTSADQETLYVCLACVSEKIEIGD